MLLFVPYSLFSSCCFLLITSVPCKYHQHSRTFVPLCLLQRMRDSKNIWIPVNFPRQMNESQGISILSKLTAAMACNYISRLYTEINLNWSVTNVSIRRIKRIYYPPISERQLVFKLFSCNSCVSTGKKVMPQCLLPVWVFLHSVQGGQDGRQDLGQGGTAMFAPSLSLKSLLSLNSVRLQPFIWRHPGASWSFQTLLSAVLRLGHYLNSCAVTSKCDVLAVDRGGRRWKQGEKRLWELSQHDRNSSPAAQTHSSLVPSSLWECEPSGEHVK